MSLNIASRARSLTQRAPVSMHISFSRRNSSSDTRILTTLLRLIRSAIQLIASTISGPTSKATLRCRRWIDKTSRD